MRPVCRTNRSSNFWRRSADCEKHLKAILRAEDHPPLPGGSQRGVRTVNDDCRDNLAVNTLPIMRGNCMKRVLITGMSGSGKSSVIQELVARRYQAYDLDTPEWSEWIDTDPSDVLTPT